MNRWRMVGAAPGADPSCCRTSREPIVNDGAVRSIPLAVLPDPEDDYALQAWVDAEADGAPAKLLVDTGTYRSSIPHVEPFASRPRRVGLDGGGVFGVPAEEMMVHADVLLTGDIVTRNLLVQLQPEGGTTRPCSAWTSPGRTAATSLVR